MPDEIARLKEWDEMLPNIKAAYESKIGSPPDGEFSDDSLIIYASRYIEDDSDITVADLGLAVAKHCADRMLRREMGKPHKDDPVGVQKEKLARESAREKRRARQEVAKANLMATENADAAAREAARMEMQARKFQLAAKVARGESLTDAERAEIK